MLNGVPVSHGQLCDSLINILLSCIVVANEDLRNHSEASCGVLKSRCMIYNWTCINTASQVHVLYRASGAAGTVSTVSSDFCGISLAPTVVGADGWCTLLQLSLY